MSSHFNANLRVESHTTTGASRRLGVRLLAAVALIAAMIGVLALDFGFARYAFTGLRWIQTDGVVTNPKRTSWPTIQFATADGVTRSFKEDYMLICGRRSLCFARNFDPGQVVPVVYDPDAPTRVYVYDWALFGGIIMWFIEAGVGLLLVLMCALAFVKKPMKVSIRLGGGPADAS